MRGRFVHVERACADCSLPLPSTIGNYFWMMPELYRMDEKPVLVPDVHRP
jgi:hypothetical protein